MKNQFQMKKQFSIDRIIIFIIFSFYAISLFGAVIWTFFVSLKGNFEYIRDALSLPENWLFSNYVKAYNELQAGGKSVLTMIGNSIWLSILPPTINLATATMASYVMGKYKFPGRDIIWSIMIFMMILPIMGNTAATYKLYGVLNFYDSPFILLTNITGLGGSFMLIASFKAVSKTYGEAAFIEGAGHFRVFWQIMVPQISGLLVALWIMSFITHWNDYMMPIMFLPSYTPITTGLYIYQIESGRLLNYPVLFAGSLMVIFVPTVLFMIFQKKFNELNFGGGIKG